MLSVIKASLIDAIHTSDAMSDEKMDKKALRWQKIEQFLQTHEYIMNADVRELCEVSSATANRILAGLVEEGKLYKARVNGHWVYQSSNRYENLPTIAQNLLYPFIPFSKSV